MTIVLMCFALNTEHRFNFIQNIHNLPCIVVRNNINNEFNWIDDVEWQMETSIAKIYYYYDDEQKRRGFIIVINDSHMFGFMLLLLIHWVKYKISSIHKFRISNEIQKRLICLLLCTSYMSYVVYHAVHLFTILYVCI